MKTRNTADDRAGKDDRLRASAANKVTPRTPYEQRPAEPALVLDEPKLETRPRFPRRRRRRDG